MAASKAESTPLYELLQVPLHWYLCSLTFTSCSFGPRPEASSGGARQRNRQRDGLLLDSLLGLRRLRGGVNGKGGGGGRVMLAEWLDRGAGGRRNGLLRETVLQ